MTAVGFVFLVLASLLAFIGDNTWPNLPPRRQQSALCRWWGDITLVMFLVAGILFTMGVARWLWEVMP